MSSDSVRCITQGTDGFYYVGTTDELSVLTLVGGLSVKCTIPQIRYANVVTGDDDGKIHAYNTCICRKIQIIMSIYIIPRIRSK